MGERLEGVEGGHRHPDRQQQSEGQKEKDEEESEIVYTPRSPGNTQGFLFDQERR